MAASDRVLSSGSECFVGYPKVVPDWDMRIGPASQPADTDQETIAQLLAKRRLLAVPVLDQEGSMLGISPVPMLRDWCSRRPEKTS